MTTAISILNLEFVTRIEKFQRINLIINFENSDDYVANVIKPSRLILVTLVKMACFLTSLRFGLTALINKVITIVLN